LTEGGWSNKKKEESESDEEKKEEENDFGQNKAENKMVQSILSN